MAKVYVLGSLNVDTIYYLKDLPKQGETIMSDYSTCSDGGKGLNQAFSVNWTGAETYIIGAVGKDPAGAGMKTVLTDAGINRDFLQESDYPTGSAVIFVDNEARNLIVVNGGANKHVAVSDIPFAAGDWLMAQLETEQSTVLEYFKIAKKAGAVTVLNISPYQQISEELAKNTDLLIVNEHEASGFFGVKLENLHDIRENIDILKTCGIGKVVITLGEDGAIALENGELLSVSGEKVDARDTQGAGDAFAGVLVGSLSSGMSLSAALKKANHIAAECVEIEGSTIVSLKSIKQN